MPKGAEQEEWRDACQRCECRRQEGLRLGQAESEGHGQALGPGKGGWQGAGTDVGAERRASRDAAVVSEQARGIGAGSRTCLGGGALQ